jgi:hypothetical protein
MGKACAAALSDMVDALLLVDLDAESAAGTAKELTGRRAWPSRSSSTSPIAPYTASATTGNATRASTRLDRHFAQRTSRLIKKDLGNFFPGGAFARA